MKNPLASGNPHFREGDASLCLLEFSEDAVVDNNQKIFCLHAVHDVSNDVELV